MFALRSHTRLPATGQVERGPANQVPLVPVLPAPVALPRFAPRDRFQELATSKAPRAASVAAATLQTVQTDDVFDSAEEEITISLKDLEETSSSSSSSNNNTMKCTIVVPYLMTKPGQQLKVMGSVAELGKWDSSKAVPLVWNEGHLHTAEVELPAGMLVEAKLALFENGSPVYTEAKSRDIMLMANSNNNGTSNGSAASLSSLDVASSSKPASTASTDPKAPKPEFQILCVWDQPEVTEVLRVPIVLPPPTNKFDDTTLCKLLVVPDQIKLEGRQRPVLVGNIPELGNWDPNNGVKLMRQVGGHWTCRVSLPLNSAQPVQAKVVICDASGNAIMWEPGTINRTLSHNASGGTVARPGQHMMVFTCQWSNPGITPTIAVPVEYENPEKEHLKQLEAALREIAVMRQSMTAKARQVQQLEADMALARKAERDLRGEVASLKEELDKTYEELDITIAHRDEAREQAELSVIELNEARKVVDIARKEMAALREQMRTLQEQLQQMKASGLISSGPMGSGPWAQASAAARAQSVGRHASVAPQNGNGRAPSSSGNGNGNGRVVSPTISSSSSSMSKNGSSSSYGAVAATSKEVPASSSSNGSSSSSNGSSNGRTNSNWRTSWRSG